MCFIVTNQNKHVHGGNRATCTILELSHMTPLIKPLFSFDVLYRVHHFQLLIVCLSLTVLKLWSFEKLRKASIVNPSTFGPSKNLSLYPNAQIHPWLYFWHMTLTYRATLSKSYKRVWCRHVRRKRKEEKEENNNKKNRTIQLCIPK